MLVNTLVSISQSTVCTLYIIHEDSRKPICRRICILGWKRFSTVSIKASALRWVSSSQHDPPVGGELSYPSTLAGGRCTTHRYYHGKFVMWFTITCNKWVLKWYGDVPAWGKRSRIRGRLLWKSLPWICRSKVLCATITSIVVRSFLITLKHAARE